MEKPNLQEYNWAFGDFDLNFIKRLKINPDMRDIFNCASIFEIKPDEKSSCNSTVTFSGGFKNMKKHTTSFFDS